MYWVDLYYNKLERVQTVDQRRVYLATDDSNLLSEAKEKYAFIFHVYTISTEYTVQPRLRP